MTNPSPPPTDDRRTELARALAETAGSKCFREPGHEWDHMRSVWLAHADAALTALQPELSRLAEYENAITWDTSCLACSRVLDSAIRETERAEKADAERNDLRTERDQYAAAIRELILTVRHTAYDWSQTQPETMRRDDVVQALNQFASMPRPMPEGLRDDLWQRIAGAYYLRFENDGHPEDSKAAADEAMAVVQPELDRRDAALDRVRQACAAVPPCIPGSQAEDVAHAKGWNAAMDHVLAALHGPPRLGANQRRHRITRQHLEAVASVYRTASANGAPPTRSVSDHFAVPHSTAAKWVVRARKQHLLPPADAFRDPTPSTRAALDLDRSQP